MQLAHARAVREDFVQPWDLEPLYMRRPDAEINWITRDGRVHEGSVAEGGAVGDAPGAAPDPGEAAG